MIVTPQRSGVMLQNLHPIHGEHPYLSSFTHGNPWLTTWLLWQQTKQRFLGKYGVIARILEKKIGGRLQCVIKIDYVEWSSLLLKSIKHILQHINLL